MIIYPDLHFSTVSQQIQRISWHSLGFTSLSTILNINIEPLCPILTRRNYVLSQTQPIDKDFVNILVVYSR